MFRASFHSSISDFDPQAWNSLFRGRNPFISHAFLGALETSGCTGEGTGWQPCHLALTGNETLVGAMPMYLKSHSHGEFVFDWSWAHAFEQNGKNYYPKLVTAIPFTPSMGPRMGIGVGRDEARVASELVAACRQFIEERSLSGWHVLFPEERCRNLLEASAPTGFMPRVDVQFHWNNRGYGDFDAFLSSLRASRRKNVRRERRRVREAGLELKRLVGSEISESDWSGFYSCYRHTYLKRSGHPGYLNRGFFRELAANLAEQLMMVTAHNGSELVASALFLFDQQRLYGRYWGALADVHSLHFECCFYQGIEFCIERGLQSFDPGTQGEHKLLRGFEPVGTSSLHLIADRGFARAIARFLELEKDGVARYGRQAREFLPFRNMETDL